MAPGALPGMHTNDTQEHLALRIPRTMADEVRRLAAEEHETKSVVIRRLLKRALQQEQRSAEPRADR
jgi:hypothetical protein